MRGPLMDVDVEWGEHGERRKKGMLTRENPGKKVGGLDVGACVGGLGP